MLYLSDLVGSLFFGACPGGRVIRMRGLKEVLWMPLQLDHYVLFQANHCQSYLVVAHTLDLDCPSTSVIDWLPKHHLPTPSSCYYPS